MDKMIGKCSLPDQVRLSQVRLRTADLEKLVEFYMGPLGLKAVQTARERRHPAGVDLPAGPRGQDARAPRELSATANGPALLVLEEERDAVPRPAGSTGLYHFAIRLPSRRDLAQAYRRLVVHKYPITGASDHGVSEAIYLSDPDGNGIELYADRPRSQWRWEQNQVAMVTQPLDLDGLLEAAPAREPVPDLSPQTRLGHIHLHVPDLEEAERFYSDYLGLAVTQRSYPGALFFAAGGYHHHIGVNVWTGKSAPPANSVGLISYRLQVPLAEVLYCLGHRAPLLRYETHIELQEQGGSILQIRDPNGAWLEIQTAHKTALLPQRSSSRSGVTKGKRAQTASPKAESVI